ncbi:MAG: AMP-binding protein [Proteobacteria bacterium]|nr:AMP-binding protein [Pseudomonadota bacterium]
MSESYVRGADTPPLLEDTIGAALERAARTWQRRSAIIAPFQNIHWTYEELNARADALATGFLELGLAPGDRVGIWAPNCAEWTLTQFAAAKAGIILVTINPAYRKAELDYALNKSGCRALVLARAHRGVEFASMLRELVAERKLPHLQHAMLIGKKSVEGFLAFDDIAATKADDRVRKIGAALKPGDAINIQFTSGTTGFHKGATLSHRNILNNGFFVGEAIGLSPQDKLCIPVPLYHCFGMVMGNLGCLTHGSAMVYPSEGFDPAAVLQTVQDEKCTALYGVPTMFIAELGQSDFAKYDLSSLRTGIMAGSPCPIEVMRHVIDKMHMREVTIAYGMTETSPVSFQSSRSDSIARRVSTVGRVLPHVEVKIVDADGNTVPRGTPGELCTRGPSVMLGYWDDEARTAEAIDAGGWMHTGDIGTIDDEGYGNITGRIKDMVIRGGENIYPREIEEFLYRHPKVADVTVVGLPDERYGEELCAWIMLKPGQSATAEDIKHFCDNQIARYKVPRYVRFVESFPMTVTGKVQKFRIREAMMEELGLTVQKTA